MKGLTRRRCLGILAASPAALALPPGAGATLPPVRWSGTALGAPAEITLHHPDTALAQELVRTAITEIRRLERIFSLYDPTSELSRLNRTGRLDAPAHELVQLLTLARDWSSRTNGAFDVTVQPLWELHAAHFKRRPNDPAGPPERALEATLARIGSAGLEPAPAAIRLARPGMGVTLNGIAQGWITDRIALLLRDAGMTDMLVGLGELRGLGRNRAGTPWRIALPEAASGDGGIPVVALDERAVATSSGSATRFEPSGRHHHLFDPRTGRSARTWRSVTVLAPTATTADALATALAILEPDAAAHLIAATPQSSAILTAANGTTTRLGVPTTNAHEHAGQATSATGLRSPVR